MSGRRIDPVDTIWLNMDRPNNLMVIDALVLLDEGVDWDRVLAAVRERLVEAFPVFRQRPVAARTPWSLPRWIDDPDFAIERHVRHARLPAPGDDEALRHYLQRHISRPLDRDHPLWEIHLIDGHRDGGALLCRLHHALADGIALSRLLLSLTDDGPEPAVWVGPTGDGFAPERAPGVAPRALGLVGAAVRGAGAALGPALSTAPGLLRRLPRRADARPVIDALVQVGRTAAIVDKLVLGHNPPNPLDREPGVEKLATWSRPFPLDEVRKAGRLAGATVNDVLMSAVAGAIAGYLVDHGAPAEDLSTMVPVNVRPLDQPLAPLLGNRFALVFVRLPVSVAEPLARLAETNRRMNVIKNSVEARLTYTLITAIGRTSPALEQSLVNFFAAKAIGVTTNVAGPRAPRYLGGAKITGVLAWVPSSGRQTVGVCIVTYANTLRVGFKVDAGTVGDPEKLVDAFNREMESLLRIAGAA